jgi:excisionase family DNA binding protein
MAVVETDLVGEGLMTIPDAARFLSVSNGTIYLLLNRGELSSAHIGRSRRIPRAAVIEFAEKAVAEGKV